MEQHTYDIAMKLQSTRRKIVDDHDQMKKRCAHIVVLRNGKVCAAHPGSVFSLNDLYIDPEDGYVHLSRWSVAGVVQNPKDNMADRIAAYNSTCQNADWEIVSYHQP